MLCYGFGCYYIVGHIVLKYGVGSVLRYGLARYSMMYYGMVCCCKNWVSRSGTNCQLE